VAPSTGIITASFRCAVVYADQPNERTSFLTAAIPYYSMVKGAIFIHFFHHQIQRVSVNVRRT